ASISGAAKVSVSLTSVRQFGQTIDGSKRNSPLALRGRLARLARHALSVDAAINRDLQAAQSAAKPAIAVRPSRSAASIPISARASANGK
ncbi:MAG: hypothetical protein WCF79_21315, partial [Rhodomicrobium sp.]